MTWIDFPPLWTAGAVWLTWLSARVLGLEGPGQVVLGAALIAAGLALMLWAAVTMVRARTNPLPHTQPSALVTHGPFRHTRNPIYLGDVMVVLGATVLLGAPLGLLAAAGLVAILRSRFILPEEARLQAAFGPAFQTWAQRTRRWV